MFISGHEHYLRLKVLRRYFQYISLGQPVCFALIKDGGKNHESAYYASIYALKTSIANNGLFRLHWGSSVSVSEGRRGKRDQTENIALPQSLISCNAVSKNKTQKETSIVSTVFSFLNVFV